MPAKTSKSSIADDLGSAGRKAFNKHRKDEVDYGGAAELPAGINGGVAQLTDCLFGTYAKGPDKGKRYFRVSATAVLPQAFEGKKVEGTRFQDMIGLCDAKKRTGEVWRTKEERIGDVLQRLKRLGLEEMDESFWDDIEANCQALVDAETYFNFDTWEKESSGRMYLNVGWKGVVEYDSNGEDNEEVIEDDAEDAEAEVEDEIGEEESEDAEDVIDDLDDLVERAAENDEDEAKNLLSARAEAAGASTADVQNAETWEEVADLIRNAEGSQADEVESEVPKVGLNYSCKPPKTRKTFDGEILEVYKKDSTVDVKRLSDGKVFKSVSWDKLDLDG